MKIDLNTSLLQPRCLSKCYCIKLESRYRLLLEYKNTFCLCRIWLLLISPPFHPLEKIIWQALCCSTSTEKLECARPSPQAFSTKHPGCTAMPWKKPLRKEKYDTTIILQMNIIFCAVSLHCCNGIFGSLNYWICSEASGLGDLTGSLRLDGGGAKG